MIQEVNHSFEVFSKLSVSPISQNVEKYYEIVQAVQILLYLHEFPCLVASIT